MDTRPHGCDGLRLQAVAWFSLTVSAHLGVCMTTDTLPTFMLFVAYATTIYKDCFDVHDVPCGPCPTKIASLCISWVRRPSSVVCASTLGTHTGTGPGDTSDALATEAAEKVDCIYHWFITP